MIRNQFRLDLNEELIVDNFAGGGGASTGIELGLGRNVDIAINHNRFALTMHEANHPQTRHIPEDVFLVDPEEATNGRPVGLAWFSPDCTHFSAARGGKPVSKRIRGLAWVALRWAVIKRPRVIILENVPEFPTWGPVLPNGKRDMANVGRTFNAFKGAFTTGIPAGHPDIPEILECLGEDFPIEKIIRGLGYKAEWREIRGFQFGAPTIRKRFFMILRCDGNPIVWPEPTHGDPASEEVKRKQRKPWRIAAECIDFRVPCPSIFLTKAEAKKLRVKRPLAKASCRRIAKGVKRYVMDAEQPFLVNLTHAGGDRVESVDEPFKTVTGANRGEKAVVDANVAGPFVTEHANGSHQRNFPGDEPLRTQCAQVKGGHFATVATFVAKYYGAKGDGGERVGSVEEPLPTQTCDPRFATAAAFLARTAHGDMDKNGKRRGRGDHSVEDPLPTICSSPDFAVAAVHVARQFGTSIGHSAESPTGTVTAGGCGKSQVVATFLAQHNNHRGTEPSEGRSIDAPFSTLTGTGSHQNLVAVSLLKYYSADQDPEIREPLHTTTTKARFGVSEASVEIPPLTPERAVMARRVADFLREHGIDVPGEFATTRSGLVIWDIGMRMFLPRELYLAQGFPPHYIIDPFVKVKCRGKIIRRRLTKTEQIEMCGNSVCPPISEALAEANAPDLAVWEPGERQERNRAA